VHVLTAERRENLLLLFQRWENKCTDAAWMKRYA